MDASGDTLTLNTNLYAYSPFSNTWSTLNTLQTTRVWGASVYFNHKIYTFDGTNIGGQYLTSVEVYNLNSNQWSYEAQNIPLPRLFTTADLVGSRIFILAGTADFLHNSVSVEVYYPGTQTWEFQSDMPEGVLTPASAVYGKYIFVFGGSTEVCITNEVQIYDTVNQQWMAENSMPTARTYPQAATIGNLIYVFGGMDTTGQITGTMEIYNPNTSTWSVGDPMLSGRAFAAAAVWNNDRVFIAGGVASASLNTISSSTEVLAP